MTEAPRCYRLEDLLQNPRLLEPPPVIIPRLVWEGRLTALGSEPKLGKSTLVGQAVAALVQGERFLDEPLTAAPALWLALDEPLGDTVRRLHGLGATAGVLLMVERPGLTELEQLIRDHGARVLVVDTVTEFASGYVEDGNAGMQWQPLYAALRGVLQRTNCGGIVLDHTGKGNPHSLVGSLQKEAGVDLVLTMSKADDSPTVRHIRARGRIPCSGFSLSWDGERSVLHTGELSLETRVYHVVVDEPLISRTRLRDRVVGKAKAIDGAVEALIRRELIEDAGNGNGHAYRVKPKTPGQGPGQGWDRPPLELLSDVGQRGSGSGQPQGQPPLSPSLRKTVGDRVLDRVLTDEEIEREAIASEAQR